MKLTVAELFAGVGGFRVGLNHIKAINSDGTAQEEGPWEFVWANQYEPATKTQHAFNCYITRFRTANHSNVDIHLVDKTTIPDHNLLVGGFPCQDYSVARSLSKEQGIEGKKGVLFWDIKDVLQAKQSSFVLLENVDRLLNSPSTRRGRDFAIMLKTFDELGYDLQWRVINAAEYGMPQKRKRVFIFAYKRNTNFVQQLSNCDFNFDKDHVFNRVFPVAPIAQFKEVELNAYSDVLDVSNNYSHGKFLESGVMRNGFVVCATVSPIVQEKATLGMIISQAYDPLVEYHKYIVAADKLDKWQYLKSSKRLERTSAAGHTYTYSEGAMAFPEKLDEPARTMLTSEGTVNRSSHIIYDANLENYRILTPLECELIQMFPKHWTNTMADRQRYFMMGNALVTGIIARLEPTLRTIIENEPD